MYYYVVYNTPRFICLCSVYVFYWKQGTIAIKSKCMTSGIKVKLIYDAHV